MERAAVLQEDSLCEKPFGLIMSSLEQRSNVLLSFLESHTHTKHLDAFRHTNIEHTYE